MPTDAERADQQEDDVLRFVEQFALILGEGGMPKMTARVFAYVLADDAERYTAAELAEGLRVSPAAISGAVRQLVQSGLLSKERAPGSRRDHYRVHDDDVWYAISMQRVAIMDRQIDFLAEGLALLDVARPGGRRVRETLEFYRFAKLELGGMLDRWREHRVRLFTEHDGRTNSDPA